MAIKIYEKFAPFANPADSNYPTGSIKNDSIPGAEDGTPLDADWANDYAGFDAALLAEAGITPSGSADTVLVSQRVNAMKTLFKVTTDSYQTATANANGIINKVGQKFSTGAGLWKTVTLVTSTAIANTSPQLYAIPLNGVWFDDFGADPTLATDNHAKYELCLSVTPAGDTIRYGNGSYLIGDNIVHPQKRINHKGVSKALTVVPIVGGQQTGTAIVFKNPNTGYYMPVPAGDVGGEIQTSRFSLFEDVSFMGSGADDDTGDNVLLKINNLGTNLRRVDFRYAAVGIECNYSVGASWEDVTSTCNTYPFWFRYDSSNPHIVPTNGAAVTQNKFSNIVGNTSLTNAIAIGWYVDATCEYGGNSHTVWDMEACYTGAKFEGRISAKDHDTVQAVGAAAWQGSGNTFDSVWFERNIGDNLVFSFDPDTGSTGEPRLKFGTVYQDIYKVSGAVNTLVNDSLGYRVMLPSISELSQGRLGTYSNPVTAGQFLLNGQEINSPLTRTLVHYKIPHQAASRPSRDTFSSVGVDWFIPDVPLVGSTINLANIQFANPVQCATVEATMTGTGASGAHHVVRAVYLVENNSDNINHVIIDNINNGAAVPFVIQAIRTTTDTFGIFLFKDPTLTEVTNATVSVNVTIGGRSGAGNQAVLNVLVQ